MEVAVSLEEEEVEEQKAELDLELCENLESSLCESITSCQTLCASSTTNLVNTENTPFIDRWQDTPLIWTPLIYTPLIYTPEHLLYTPDMET